MNAFGASNTSALAFGGSPPPSRSTATELWNGTNWSENSDLSQATSLAGDTKGPISSGAVFGGGAPSALSNTEEWSSTSQTTKTISTD